MAVQQNTHGVVIASSSAQNLCTINVIAELSVKHSPTKDPSWGAHFHSLLLGYDLPEFIDGSITENNATILNLHLIDQVMPLLALFPNSHELWLQDGWRNIGLIIHQNFFRYSAVSTRALLHPKYKKYEIYLTYEVSNGQSLNDYNHIWPSRAGSSLSLWY